MRRLVLAASVALLLGADCNQGSSVPASAWLYPPVVTASVGQVVELEVLVNAPDRTIQAFDFEARVTPPILVPYSAEPHAEFDDDGALFGTPEVDFANGRMTGLVDLRHGEGLTGNVRVLRLRFYALATGTATVTLEGDGVADAAGALLDEDRVGSAVTITAP